MNVDERVAAFMALAEEEASAAQALIAGFPRQAAYQLQQAAEKMVRAILAAEGIAHGTGHNLGQMAAALPLDHPWRPRAMRLDKHSPAATRWRYPAPGGRLPPPPSQETLRRDLDEL
ncbi:MAG TPA: HEPN domain-containing protein, partial [Candidatus Omnitrophota bacterium]|nr:HEPN domain-containing protein [Candidatus Omnitrophota bacterium]